MKRSSHRYDRPAKNTANVAEIKAHFSHFLRQVAAGQSVTVTNRDRPVAQLVPPAEERNSLRTHKPLKVPAALAGLLNLPPLGGRRTDSLELLLEDRRKR